MAIQLLAGGAGLVSGLFGAKGSSLPAAIAKVHAHIDGLERARDQNTLRLITLGGTVDVPPWGAVNFSDGKPERDEQRAYARAALSRVQAGLAPPPAPAPVAGTGRTPSTAEAVIQAALNAGQLELAARVGDTAEQARVQAQGRTAAGLFGSLSPGQLIVLVAVAAVVVMVLLRKGRA